MLTPKEETFVENYLVTFNKRKAAEGLYPSTLTRQQLCIRGTRLYNKPHVQQAIRLRLDERMVSTNELLDRWAEQARAEYTNYILPDGTVNVHQLIADGKSHLIKRIRHTRFGLDVEFYDAQKAQEMIARHYGLFDDSIRVKDAVVVTVRYADEVEESTPSLPVSDDSLIDEDFIEEDLTDGSSFIDVEYEDEDD